MSDIDRLGIEHAITESLGEVDGPGFVHVSLDMDALDPDVAPASARPCAAGSPIARPISRWSSSPSRG